MKTGQLPNFNENQRWNGNSLVSSYSLLNIFRNNSLFEKIIKITTRLFAGKKFETFNYGHADVL